MNFRFLILLLSFAIIPASCVSVQVKDNTISHSASEIKKPKNIILLIGDGMGLSQVSTAIYYKDGKPNFERFGTIGLSKTSSASDLVTDSAAGATVFSAAVAGDGGGLSAARHGGAQFYFHCAARPRRLRPRAANRAALADDVVPVWSV